MQSTFDEYNSIDDDKKAYAFPTFWCSYLACVDGYSVLRVP